MTDPQLSRMTPAEIIEELRDEAADLAEDLKGIPAEETVYGEAAQLIEEMGAALTLIAGGAEDPQGIAKAVLDTQAPLQPIGGAMDTLRGLLKPRSV